MPNILVRDVPPEVHAQLLLNARSRGQSLQQFLQEALAEIARRPRASWTSQQAVDEIERWARESAVPGASTADGMTGADLIREIRGPVADGDRL
ncbi:MAG: hypothetical protein NTX29_02480 [Actinobacteria bacterium]|nr:hypothetical protein [Actinomycetota bacterium]